MSNYNSGVLSNWLRIENVQRKFYDEKVFTRRMLTEKVAYENMIEPLPLDLPESLVGYLDMYAQTLHNMINATALKL